MAAFLTFSVFIAVVAIATTQEEIYRVCSTRSQQSACEQIDRSQTIKCEPNYHSVDCMLNIELGKTDFGRVSAEEALIGASFLNNVVVLGEFRSDDAIQNDSSYSTVVLVNKNYVGGLQSLRGMKYCHPGFKYDEVVSELLLKEFEMTVLKANKVDSCSSTPTNTLLEMEIQDLSEFFGPSCRPGPWIDIDETNNKFYNQYSKLCDLCTSSEKCSISKGTTPFLQSLNCLVNNGGDVALTTLNSVYDFFNEPNNIGKLGNYKYLCKNGSTTDSPCIWSKQPWDIIIAHKDRVEGVKSKIDSIFKKNVLAFGASPFAGENSDILEQYLMEVLFPLGTHNKINILSNNLPLKQYVTNFRQIPTIENSEKCKRDVKWCTVSDMEQQKCEWLAQASINRAIQPILRCKRARNKFDCLEDIKIDQVDVVTSDAHYGYISRKKDLAPLAYPDTYSKKLISTIVVVKRNDTISRFEDLRNKRACLPEYAGIEWLSLITTLREHGLLSNSKCNYDTLIDEFVGDSCMPGAHDVGHEKSSNINSDKLCALCRPVPNSKTATTCNSDSNNMYSGDVGALKCLQESGDFAVITNGEYSQINESDYNVLCKNGSLASHSGFNVDSSCALSTIVDSEVVSKKHNPKNQDIRVILLNLERRFGTDRHKPFEVFNTFNSTLDLLFKDSTPGLVKVDSQNPYIKNYLELFAHTEECVEEGDDDGSAVTIHLSTILLLMVTTLFILN